LESVYSITFGVSFLVFEFLFSETGAIFGAGTYFGAGLLCVLIF